MPGADPHSQHAAAVFSSPSTLSFIAYVIFPTLAAVTVIFGVILLSRDNIAGGLLFFGLLQVWVVAGILAHLRRRRLPSNQRRQPPAGD